MTVQTNTERVTPGMAKQARVFWAVTGYMGCSATLLVGNKLAISLLPAPSFILWAQLLGTVIAVKSMQTCGIISHCDKLEVGKAKAFIPVALIFMATIFSNLKSLEYANVETFMIFRFSTPIAISVCDFLFLGRQLPKLRSWCCLLGLLIGATGYALTDSHFRVEGYIFCAIWYTIFCLDQVYLKHITNTVKMESNWGRVFYSNLLASIPLFFMTYSELPLLLKADTTALLVVLATVGLGAAMSYYAWLARSLVSATFFTVLGNVCKVISIGLNVALWDKHASEFGLACLLFSLLCAYFYKQAPMRETSKQTDIESSEVVEANKSDNSNSTLLSK
uniref:Sugar phosphate transporter domain-containing protein n=1 Tax=Aureoumbra lagunensis TaxID=44058 RepID=A0A7S3NM54_9STRA|mmetsp:Transcript_7734/g.10770  ORF Transcript_7734/g.10770 Transcript_7734/m.10770 type:complete len:335 (+) Transcript_7734:131-1135(+)